MSQNKPRLYRPCVGIALFNNQGQVFVGERIDTPGAWQMPQGGVDEGENLQIAAFRELQEETGVSKAEIIRQMPDKLRYDIPGDLPKKLWHNKYVGQEQSWFAMRYLGEDNEINLEYHPKPEFSQWKWIDLSQTINLVVPFKRDVYSALIEEFSDLAA